MKWSREMPTEPGYYWFRCRDAAPVVARVEFEQTIVDGKPRGESRAFFIDAADERRPLNMIGGWWRWRMMWSKHYFTEHWTTPLIPPEAP